MSKLPISISSSRFYTFFSKFLGSFLAPGNIGVRLTFVVDRIEFEKLLFEVGI